MPFTITRLTIQQFLRSRSMLVVVGLSMLPAALAILVQIAPGEVTLRAARDVFDQALYRGMFVGTLLPLATLILATSAVGDEVEDRTLQYLVLKPIPRWQIVAEKALAVLVVTIPAVSLGVLVSWLIVGIGNHGNMTDLLRAALLASPIAVLGFGMLFMLLSMVIQRALLVGIFYVFVWETALSRWLPGIRSISIRHFTESQYVRMADDRWVRIDSPSAELTVLISIAVITVVSIVLGTWRLRAMSLE